MKKAFVMLALSLLLPGSTFAKGGLLHKATLTGYQETPSIVDRPMTHLADDGSRA